MEKRVCANGNDKKARIAILILWNIDFKTKCIAKNKEGYYIMTKGSIQEENIILNNMYAANTGTSKYTKQILIGIKGEIDNNAIIVGNFNILFTSMERSSRKKNQYDDSGL